MMLIGAVAIETGLSVRTLRHWEATGLLSPLRTLSRQRVYGADHLIRIGHIQTLKKAGFTLAAIKEMLDLKTLDANQILAVQIALLEEQGDAINRALRALKLLRKSHKDGRPMTLADLTNLIKIGGFAMSDEDQQQAWQKVYDTFFSKEEQERWAKAKMALSPEAVTEAEEKWPRLIARVEGLIAAKIQTDDPKAGECVQEWRALTKQLVATDPALMQSAGRLYDQMDNWPEGSPEAPFSPLVWAFIKEAGEHFPDD